MKKIEPKYLIRSDEDYHEFNLSFCGRSIKRFKKSYFRNNSKHQARIFCKVFFPPDCPEHLWMYYLVFEVNRKPYEITSITREAFDVLTRNIEADRYTSIEFYTLEQNIC